MRVVHCLREGRALCGRMEVPRDWPKEHVWVSLDDWLGMEEPPEGACPACADALRKYIAGKAERATAFLTPGGRLTEAQSARFLDYLTAGIREEEAAFRDYLGRVRERLLALSEGEPDEVTRRVMGASEEPGSDVTLALFAAFLERTVRRLDG